MEILIWLAQHKSQISPIFFVLDFQLIILDVNIINSAQIPTATLNMKNLTLNFFGTIFS